MHDLAIVNARLCDGMGNPLVEGALAVRQGRIAEVGAKVGPARRTVDAEGAVLAPGIIDSHTHFDAQITWDPLLTPSPALGVTTAVIGNCGFTIAPCRPADRELTMRNLTHVEGMALDVLRQGIRWDFETIPQYLDMLERLGSALNVAAFAGHSAIRTYVMGKAAPERAATADEVARMRAIVLEAVKAGCCGFATSTSPSHNGEGGIPMPSRRADEAELRALVGALGEAGRGVFMLTKGGGTKVPFLESLAAETGRPVVVAALLHNTTNPDAVFADLRDIAAARGRGRQLWGQVSCCPLTNDFTMRSPYPFEGLAAWAPAMRAHDEAALRQVLADPSFRQAIKDELARPAVVRLFNGEWDKLDVIEAARPEHARHERRSVAELAREAGKHPLDWMLDLALADDLGTVFTAVLLNADEAAVGRLLTDPHANIALSDAGAHLTFFCDAGFGLHLLGHWVRDRGTLSLTEAMRKLTSEQAAILGIRERGALKPGWWADLFLFDPETVGRGPKQKVRDLPGGAPRLTTAAVGVKGVWVNGRQVAGAAGILPDGGRPGALIREFG